MSCGLKISLKKFKLKIYENYLSKKQNYFKILGYIKRSTYLHIFVKEEWCRFYMKRINKIKNENLKISITSRGVQSIDAWMRRIPKISNIQSTNFHKYNIRTTSKCISNISTKNIFCFQKYISSRNETKLLDSFKGQLK